MRLTAADTTSYTAEFEALTHGKSYAEKCSILRDSIEKTSTNNLKNLSATRMYYRLIQAEKNNPAAGWAMQKLGRAYWQIGEFDSAFVYYSSASTFLVNQNVPLEVFDNYIYMGLLFVATKDYLKAEFYFRQASQYLGRIKPWRIQKHRTSVNYWNLAHVYTKLQHYGKASRYLTAAFSILTGIDSIPGHYLNTAHCLTNYYMGNLQTCLHHYDSAIYYYHTSIQLSRNKSDNYILSNALAQIGVPFNALHLYDSTILYCSESLSIAEVNGNHEYKPLALKQLAEAYSATHQYQKAFEYYKRFKITSDSINNYDRVIAGYIYQKAENEKIEIEARKNEAELRQKYTVIISSAIILSILIIAFILLNRYKIIQKLNRRLTESNTTKNKLFSIIAHDLRTPLSGMKNLSNLILENSDTVTQDEREKYLRSFSTTSANIMNLLDNLLHWSQIQTGRISYRPEHIPLHDILHLETDTLTPFADQKAVSIIVDVPNYSIFVDKYMISTAIRNILTNAIKYSKPKKSIHIHGVEEQKSVVLSIVDQGIGMSNEDMQNIFRIDHKVSRLGTSGERGTGIGLTLSKEFAEKNGGALWCESEVGKGSVFYIRLPKSDVDVRLVSNGKVKKQSQ